MSDLISRSELIKHFETIQKQENAISLDFVAIIDEIKEQPTTYDIEKVVEELDRLRITEGGLKLELIPCDRAIEIVKQGSVTDDVCKWKLEYEEANLYLTECQQRQLIFDGTLIDNGYRYCPYCGNKIKVVE